MKRYTLIIVSLLIALFVSACGNDDSTINDDKNIKEIVHNYTIGELEASSASINSHELIVQGDGKETVYKLPEDEFFVSIAPFVSSTHECAIHSLTTCQGELVEESFDVTIETDDGEVIVDKEMTTFENGFIDLWLPRDQTFTVTIEQDGKVAISELSTFKGDDTCITTMQLVGQR